MKFSASIICLLISGAAVPAFAQDICQNVLNSATFNTYSRSFQQNLRYSMMSDFCSLNIKTEAEFRNRAQQASSGGRYGVISGFLNGAQSKTGMTYEQIYARVCEKRDAALVNDVMSVENDVNTEANIRAWRDCVLNREGATASIKVSQDTVHITVSFKPFAISPTQKLVIKSATSGFDCNVSGNKLDADFTPVDKGILGSFVIECKRTDASAVLLSINTAAHPLGPFDVPKPNEIKEITALAVAESRAIELERRIETLINGLIGPRALRADCAPGVACFSPACDDNEMLVGVACFAPGENPANSLGRLSDAGRTEANVKRGKCQMHSASGTAPLLTQAAVSWCARIRP
jgi:hypothetical protein